MKLPVHEYLGDGAYITWDGFQFALKANDHLTPTETVYFGYREFENLKHFVQKIFIKSQIDTKSKIEEGTLVEVYVTEEGVTLSKEEIDNINQYILLKDASKAVKAFDEAVKETEVKKDGK